MKRFASLFVVMAMVLPVLTHDSFESPTREPAAEGRTNKTRGVLTVVEGFVGGIHRCQDPTKEELSLVPSRLSHSKVVGPAPDAGPFDKGLVTNYLEDLFFQEMAHRSHAATTCQSDFINSYFNDRSIENTLNGNGWIVFQSFQDVLRKLIITRNEKFSMSENIRLGHDPMDRSTAQMNLDIQGAELREEARELDLAINAIIAQIPLGSHVLVRDALRKLALVEHIREPDFIDSYSKSLEALKPKLQKAKEYFDGKLDKNGTYDISRKDKIAFMRSGRASVLLGEVDPEGTRLACRLKAQYSSGPATTQLVAMLGLLVASAVTDGAAAFLVGLGLTGTMINDIQRECFKPTMNISAEKTLTCDPKQMARTSITEASMVSCGVAVGFFALPTVRTFASEIKSGLKAYQKAKNVSKIDNELFASAQKAAATVVEKPIIPKVSPANTAELKALQSELGACVESLPKDLQKRLRIKFHNQSEEKTLRDLRDMRDLRRINGACK